MCCHILCCNSVYDQQPPVSLCNMLPGHPLPNNAKTNYAVAYTRTSNTATIFTTHLGVTLLFTHHDTTTHTAHVNKLQSPTSTLARNFTTPLKHLHHSILNIGS